jgi:hypothetical protein
MKRLIALAVALAGVVPVYADTPKATKPAEAAPEIIYPTGYLRTEDWLKASTKPISAAEIDRLVGEQLAKANVKPAPLTSDEQFLRRVYLDVTGKLPSPSEVREFLLDKSPDKRAKVIDKLLGSDDYARHWALYWRDVIVSRMTNQRAQPFTRHFEKWLTDQLKDNKTWDEITRAMLTATGEMRYAEPDKNGQAFFLATRTGADTATEMAAETSRVFLGIQIQCAQCHDHPSDVWKRQQFHEFAAYFARYRERLLREEQKFVGTSIASLPGGEHRMPDLEDARKGTPVVPKFLDGKGPKSPAGAKGFGQGFKGFAKGPKGSGGKGPKGFGGGFGGLPDLERRKSLADSITSTDNPWFAGAFVNRVWGELMGQAFYMPIDDMGPEKEAFMPEVLARVAGSFRGNDYDTKELFRAILNSETYQRQLRPGDSPDQHQLFAAHNPTRMSANALWQSLVNTLGPLNALGGGKFGKGFGGGGPFAGRFGVEGQFKQEFGFDPSIRPEEVEGSVSQALLMMNNPAINQKIRATGNNMLARILTTYSEDDEAIRAVYMKALARRPTNREVARCREHIRGAGSRAEAFEDILWALINSTEYQTQR